MNEQTNKRKKTNERIQATHVNKNIWYNILNTDDKDNYNWIWHSNTQTSTILN